MNHLPSTIRHPLNHTCSSRSSGWPVLATAFFNLWAATGAFGAPQSAPVNIALFFEAAAANEAQANQALEEIAENWQDGYTPIVLDMVRLLVPSSPTGRRLMGFLETQTGQGFGSDWTAWRRWSWQLPYDPHPDYPLFKGALYWQIDPRMAEFFPPGLEARIRLDEVEWGGVRVNGIPPLDHPEHIPASEADYLEDGHIVFGISINGEARAYPKRILAWHEMTLDLIGGVELTTIYCTLCGTVLPYESEVGGKRRRFGTSGLLYRSNKLFFDEATMSLWSTLEGKPVVGELVGQGLELKLRSSVTTTWGEWKRQHPDTTVLSIDTGHSRDYGEGVAYRDYFANDRLMFQVPETDERLLNKDEVLVMQVDSGQSSSERIPVAIAARFLDENRIFPFEVSGHSFVVVTSQEGANRVYEVESVPFTSQRDSGRIVDETGTSWRLEEDALVSTQNPEVRLPRVTANRAFWFGWYAQFPQTQLFR